MMIIEAKKINLLSTPWRATSTRQSADSSDSINHARLSDIGTTSEGYLRTLVGRKLRDLMSSAKEAGTTIDKFHGEILRDETRGHGHDDHIGFKSVIIR
jgi:hypothetical protein